MLNPRILIVDDEAHVRQMLISVFKEKGYQDVASVDGYESALVEISRQSFDVIFCDIMLGGKTGIDLLETLRARGVETPLVLITGRPDLETAIQALRKGAVDYLRKPVRINELLKLTEKAYQQKIEMENQHSAEAQQRERLDRELTSYRTHLEKLQTQLESAADIYRHLMKPEPHCAAVAMHWKHRPLAVLGGDFIDVRETSDRLDIMVADVAGHDIGCSFHTMLLKSFFEANCRHGNDGQTLFNLMNRHLIASGNDQHMISALFMRVHLLQLEGDLISAAHPYIIRVGQDSSEPDYLIWEASDILGIYPEPIFVARRVQFQPGDRLFIYTDGVPHASKFDTQTGLRKKLDRDQFNAFVQQHRHESLEKMLEKIWQSVLDYCDHRPQDDMLLWGMEIPRPSGDSISGAIMPTEA